MPCSKGHSGNLKGSIDNPKAGQQLLEEEAEILTHQALELASRREIVIVLVRPGKSEEEAWQEHLSEHPEDKNADKVFFLDSF